jgi:predicted GNAT family acetyltransferase
MSDSNDIGIVHNAAQNRFEAHVDGDLGHLDYRIAGDAFAINHTEVPPSLGGRGIAGKLVAAAVAYARGAKLRVVANCSYARAWIAKHPEALQD